MPELERGLVPPAASRHRSTSAAACSGVKSAQTRYRAWGFLRTQSFEDVPQNLFHLEGPDLPLEVHAVAHVLGMVLR